MKWFEKDLFVNIFSYRNHNHYIKGSTYFPTAFKNVEIWLSCYDYPVTMVDMVTVTV